ncbi:hypothetical protein AAG587_08215 [Vreelandella neptunia]|uniref:hypothetical protein n=1 Tax=Vreelandella neptunia TaxID=115551 RepID=UPI00315AEB59
MTRDEVRATLKEAGITVANVTEDEIKGLRRIVNKHLKASGIYEGTAKLRRAKKDLRFLEMQTHQWERREAISFNPDGFIGVAGWADKWNVQPFLSALLEWSSTRSSAQ